MQEAHLQVNHAVEFIGKVQNDLSVKALVATDFGTNFGTTGVGIVWMGAVNANVKADFDVANEVVNMTLRYPELFYDKE